MIRKLEERRCLISVAEEFRINKSVILRSGKAFQTIGTTFRNVSEGRPKKTIAVDDRYIILQGKRALYQSASAIAKQLCTASGRQVSRFTVARHLSKGCLFAHCHERFIRL
ncbi:transposable element Tcb2 transposase [Trichonephila clavipes]|nr:transposable element Tcb2 transposase [Trichonephila clavipes]